MNTFLWVTQAVLAIVYLAHGLVFLFPPEAVRKIKKQSPFPEAFSRFISSAEILAAFGPRSRRPGWRPSWPARWSSTCRAGRSRQRSSRRTSSRSRSSWPACAGS